MQVDIRHPSPPTSNTLVREKRVYNTTTNEPFNETRKTVLKGMSGPILKISFFARDGGCGEQENVKREGSPSKKRKL
jgi:hypothetical protein